MFRHITDDTFTKSYAYNIRHNYGLEGKRANYNPYPCVRIITTNAPSVGDHHGCPFKHFSQENLRNTILHFGVRETEAETICETAQNGHYQVACTRYFEAIHPNVAKESVMAIEHPNQFYQQSLEFTKSAGSNGMDVSR
jgi:DNA primase large subunit